MTKKNNLENMTFEEALEELELIVNKLEAGEVTLEDAVEAYERGSKLKDQCQRRLNEAKMKVEKIKEGDKENLDTEKYEI
tara:strand:+ start:992 stop:1231 length:240 start_codon:yes stop_codon:yes gene_type:complete